MLEKIEMLVRKAKKAADIIKKHEGPIRILADYDCDGITASAIIVKSLLKEGKSFHITNTRQIGEEEIKFLSGCRETLLVFIDFGSGQLNNINNYLHDKDVVIIDHHQKQGEVGERVVFVNPIEFDVSGDISSSGVSYIVARAMDMTNKDLAEIAVIGAIGDAQAGAIGPHWGVYGINAEILKDSISSKKMRVTKGLRIWGRNSRPLHKALEYSIDPYIPEVTGSESQAIQFLKEIGIDPRNGEGWRKLSDLSTEEEKRLASAIIIERIRTNHENPEWIFGDVYELVEKPQEYNNANEFATIINACGKSGNASLGIRLCLNDPEAFSEMPKVLDAYRRQIGKGLGWVYKNRGSMVPGDVGDYMLAGSSIPEHILSNVISIIHKTWDEKRMLFGFADSEKGVKVSARASDFLVREGINLKDIVSEACRFVGGEGGGHAAASGGTIPKLSEHDFIKAVEGLVSDRLKLKGLKAGDLKEKPLNAPESGKRERTIMEAVEKTGGSDAGKIQEKLITKDLNSGSLIKASYDQREAEGRVKGKKMEGKGLVQYFGS